MKTLLLLLALQASVLSFAQEIYYEMPNGKVVDKNTYQKIKEAFAEKGKVKENFIDEFTRNDSVIKRVNFSIKGGKVVSDPFAKFKEKIGKKIRLSKLKDEQGKSLKNSDLSNKPTFISFWFTTCPPCIKEIPLLNEIKEEYADRFNFIAVTFSEIEEVKMFLEKRSINFDHYYADLIELSKMDIIGYPMNILLNEEGALTYVSGEISHSKKKMIREMNKLL